MGGRLRQSRFIRRAGAIALAVIVSTFPEISAAYDWSVIGRVTNIEPSYMPGWINFQLDTSVGACAAGTWLAWNAVGADQAAKIANANAVYATLLSAKLSSRTITAFGVNNGCVVDHLHLSG